MLQIYKIVLNLIVFQLKNHIHKPCESYFKHNIINIWTLNEKDVSLLENCIKSGFIAHQPA